VRTKAGELPLWCIAADFGRCDDQIVLVACAWCERVSSDGEAWFQPRLWLLSLRSNRLDDGLSHGICPSCFSKHAPDTPYPVRE
jgi:hypothetical protein